MKQTIAEEVKMLRSFAMSIVGRDSEGEYRPEFVKHIMEMLKKGPTHSYKSSKQFLADLSGHD